MKRASFAIAVLAACFQSAQLHASPAQSPDPVTALRKYAPNQYHPLGDYVPCMFDDDEALTMRSLPAKNKAALDADGAKALVSLANAQLLEKYGTSGPATDATGKQKALQSGTPPDKLSTSLNSSTFEYLTIDDAFAKLGAAAKASGLPSADAQTLVSNVRAKIGGASSQRPEDVSCSFSILPWEETDQVFGRMVANRYIAIEVNIRNLNDQSEFLLHDIQVAVDTGLGPEPFGRFEAGRDKMIVRAVAQRGESDDVRNRVINSLAMAGALAGGASGALTQTVQVTSSMLANWLSTSVAVFQGPFLSGLGKLWPDHTITNVNNVSDLAFSASSAMKTVVPIQGSVPLATFIAKKPLEQLPFAWCGAKKKPGSFAESNCSVSGNSDNAPWDPDMSKNFKSWSPAALNILKHRTFVVVSGVHIQELAPNAAANNISCPTVTDLTVNLSAQDASGDVSCTISGANLGSAKSAKLEQGTSTSVSATLTPASDGNTAALSFKASDFAGKSGAFTIFAVDGSSRETNLGQSLPFKVRPPTITNVAYSPAKLDKTADLTVTITGSNLDRMTGITFIDHEATPVSVSGTVTAPSPVLAQTPSITVTVKQSDLGKFTVLTDGPARLQYETLDDPKTRVSAPSSADKGLLLK